MIRDYMKFTGPDLDFHYPRKFGAGCVNQNFGVGDSSFVWRSGYLQEPHCTKTTGMHSDARRPTGAAPDMGMFQNCW